MPKIYTAGKCKHAAKWVAIRSRGNDVNSTWIDDPRDKEADPEWLADLWVRCVTEAATADAVLFYCESGERHKGSLVEVGAALASGKPVYVVFAGNDSEDNVELRAQFGTWVNHPLVRRATDIQDALERIRKECR